jgi:purine-binding chemotaxis protein CheW
MVESVNIELTTEDVMYGKYLTFRIGQGIYGIEIKYVTEIIGVQEITAIPHTSDYVRGIINLRGQIVPVIDCSMRFGGEQIVFTERTCIVELGVGGMSMGLLVDDVDEVITIEDESIQQPPRIGEDGLADSFVKKIGLYEGSVKQLLDIDHFFEEQVTEVQ